MNKLGKVAVALAMAFGSVAFGAPIYRSTLTVTGYSGASTLEDFPLLVRISPERIIGFSYAQVESADNIAFTDTDGNALPFEIDTWNPAGESLIWVKVPAISGKNTQIAFEWGVTSAAATVPTDVWSAYAGVWHLGEATEGYADSTGHGLTAVNAVSETITDVCRAKAGVVGNGRWQPKLSLQIPSYDNLEVGGVFTASGWYYMDERTGYESFFNRKQAWNTGDGWQCNLQNNDKNVFVTGGGTATSTSWNFGSSVKGRWVYVTLVYNGTKVSLYENGSKVGNDITINAVKDNGRTLAVGNLVTGTLDELRICQAVSSADWIKADYEQVSNADFVTAAPPSEPDILIVSGSPKPFGVVSPAYGVMGGFAVGESFVCTASARGTNAEETIVYECRGYTVYTNGFVYVEGTGNSFEYTHPDCEGGAELVWKWEPAQYKLDIGVAGGGTVDVESQFVTSGGVVAVTATPAAGMKFWKWTGTAAAAATRYSTNTTVTVSAAKTLTANFYDPATATPTNVYVTVDGAGTMDGSDWDNAMKSITKAYALCADNPAGGTVHLAGGFYRSNKGNFTSGAGVVLAERVTLRGETDPYGDTPVVITGDQSLDDVWNDITGTPKIWVNNAYQPPSTRTRLGAKSKNDTNFMSGTAAADCTFENILFNGFTGYALSISKAPNLTVRKCRFLGFGSTAAHPTENPVTLSSCENLLVDGCEIEGGNFGLYISADANWTATVRDTRIANIRATGAYASSHSGIYFGGSVKPRVYGCTFERVYNEHQSSPGSTLVMNAASAPIISNCVFRSCVANGGCGGVVGLSKAGPIKFIDTLFIDNSANTSDKGGYAKACCVCFNVDGSVSSYFRNVAFVRNKIIGGPGNSCASVLSEQAFGSHRFVNCTFDGNCATGASWNVSTIGGWRPQNVGFANCVFRNNDVLVGASRSVEINGCYSGSVSGTEANNSRAPTFTNTIMWHDADDYKPLTLPAEGKDNAKYYGVVSSLIKGFTPVANPGNDGWTYQPEGLGTNPCLRAGLEECETGSRLAPRLEIDAPSALRRKGVPVYAANNGNCYFLDTHKSPNVWRPAGSSRATASLSIAEGEAVGLVPGMDPIPDAFGEPRKASAVAMGALNAPTRGLKLLVK